MKKIKIFSSIALIAGAYLLGFGILSYEQDFILGLASMLLGTFFLVGSLENPCVKNF